MNFEMTGILSMPRETDKFKPYSVVDFSSGYSRKRIMPNLRCGDNMHMLTVEYLYKTDGTGNVFTRTKDGKDDDGNTVKGENIQVPFNKRDKQNLDEIADRNIFVFDLDTKSHRNALENAAEHIKNGQALTDDELKACGVADESEVAEALEKSKKKHHAFLCEYDFIDFIKKVLDSGKYKDALFNVRGTMRSTYNEEGERFYDNLVPQKIYLAEANATPRAVGSMIFEYGTDSLDTGSAEEKERYYVNGWEMVYDSNRKANIPHPVTIAIDTKMVNDKGTPVADGWKKKFEVSDEKIREYGISFNMINGAQRKEISLDDLDDEIREDIEMGLVTLEEVQREMGGNVYGPRVQEYLFAGPRFGWKSKRPEETAFTIDDMVIKPIDDGLDGDLFDEDKSTVDDDDDI